MKLKTQTDNKLLKKYYEYINIVSDINEHLPTLYQYGKKCNSIIEMGVRSGVSTYALLASQPEIMTSYDINKHDAKIDEMIFLSKVYDIKYKFIISDVLFIDIKENTDLLFIDTLHTYNQLYQELSLHASKIEKFIIMHDTTTYGYIDETIYNHASEKIKNQPKTKQGLIPAIEDFLNSKEGSNWFIKEKFDNNNGLIILERKK